MHPNGHKIIRNENSNPEFLQEPHRSPTTTTRHPDTKIRHTQHKNTFSKQKQPLCCRPRQFATETARSQHTVPFASQNTRWTTKQTENRPPNCPRWSRPENSGERQKKAPASQRCFSLNPVTFASQTPLKPPPTKKQSRLSRVVHVAKPSLP